MARGDGGWGVSWLFAAHSPCVQTHVPAWTLTQIPLYITIVVFVTVYIILLIVFGSELVKYCTCVDDNDGGLWGIHKCETNRTLAWKYKARRLGGD